jgi:predicted Fe-Mo cluster-binding NifX family protein
MKVCVPTAGDAGVEEQIFPHFGSAPLFTLVDTETGAVQVIPNQNLHHAHGRCDPTIALGGAEVDAVIVRGIGAAAANRLTEKGIAIYQSQAETVGEAVAALQKGSLLRVSPQGLCREHTDSTGQGSAQPGHRHRHGHGCC